jgi:hypothetical protein
MSEHSNNDYHAYGIVHIRQCKECQAEYDRIHTLTDEQAGWLAIFFSLLFIFLWFCREKDRNIL